jgi:probable rRNA maturation factor
MNARVPSHAGSASTSSAGSGSDDDPGPSCPAQPADAESPQPEPASHESGPVTVACAPAVWTPVDVEWLREQIRRAAEIILADRPMSRVSVMIVDDGGMRDLHARHKGSEETTDVLTFEGSSPEEPLEVDIAVCADVAERHARDLDHPVERELLLYAVHGLLHCAGFDDHDEASAATMHAEEDHIMEALGAGPTFAPGGRGNAEEDGADSAEPGHDGLRNAGAGASLPGAGERDRERDRGSMN